MEHEYAGLVALSKKWSRTFRIGITGGLGETPIGIINRMCHLETVPVWRRSRAENGASYFRLLGIPQFGDDDFWVKVIGEVSGAEYRELETDLTKIFPRIDARVYSVYHRDFGTCGGLLFDNGIVHGEFGSWQKFEGEQFGDVMVSPDLEVLPFGDGNMLRPYS
jgi:hypothetical protein